MTLRWFVTGAAGFIGSNVCRYLLNAGHAVTGFDNFSSGKRANIDRLSSGNGPFDFIEGDVRDAAGLKTSMAEVAPDVVLHLAAQVKVQESILDYTGTNAVNVGGFLNAIAATHQVGAGRFLFASSCAVYGNNDAFPLNEDSRVDPISPYGLSKLVDEQYADVLRPTLDGMELAAFRFFNIYGPWQDAAGGYAAVIPKWIDLMLAGKRPVIFGDGSATRDFIFVEDVARLIETVATFDGALPAHLYAVCTGHPTSLNDLYRKVVDGLARCGQKTSRMEPDHQPWRDGDIVHSLGDPSRAVALLGYRPAYDLRTGIDAILREQHGLVPVEPAV